MKWYFFKFLAKCVKGEATYKEVEIDPDLGKSTRHGFRNVVKEEDRSRVFGVPTIRTDIKAKSFKSVADPNVKLITPNVL